MIQKSEMVGIVIHGTCYSGKEALLALMHFKKYQKFITRDVAKMAYRLDLGERWKWLSESPTLFVADDNGNLQDPEDPEQIKIDFEVVINEDGAYEWRTL